MVTVLGRQGSRNIVTQPSGLSCDLLTRRGWSRGGRVRLGFRMRISLGFEEGMSVLHADGFLETGLFLLVNFYLPCESPAIRPLLTFVTNRDASKFRYGSNNFSHCVRWCTAESVCVLSKYYDHHIYRPRKTASSKSSRHPRGPSPGTLGSVVHTSYHPSGR